MASTPRAIGTARDPGPDTARRRLATAAMVGVVLYIAVDVVLQFLPPHYNPISEAESDLAVGPFGWIMNVNFLARAVLSGCAVAALARVGTPTRLRTAGLWLFAVAGLCSAALAFFATDVAPTGDALGGDAQSGVVPAGYGDAPAVHGDAPAVHGDAPAVHGVATTTTTGAIHLALATGGFVAALVAFALLTVWMRGVPALRSGYRSAQVFLVIAVVGILSLGASIAFVPGVLGLAERLCLAGILGWVFVVCAAVRRV